MRAIEKKLRERVQELEKELDEVKQDREEFRDHFAKRFKWWLELIGKQQAPPMTWLIESDAKWLRRFQWWQW
ncbi:MAG: hypothetical protein ACRCZI_11485 [Cetobacterium sp.]